MASKYSEVSVGGPADILSAWRFPKTIAAGACKRDVDALLLLMRRAAKLKLPFEQRSSIDTVSTSEKHSLPGPILTSAERAKSSVRKFRHAGKPFIHNLSKRMVEGCHIRDRQNRVGTLTQMAGGQGADIGGKKYQMVQTQV